MKIMLSKNEDIRIVKTKQAIKGAFSELLEKTPYSRISIIDICDSAKVHRATFYNYYRSKEDLFSCIIEDEKDRFIQNMEDSKCETRSSVINYLVDSFINVAGDNSSRIRNILKVKGSNIIKIVLNKSIYQIIYQILSLYSNGEQIIPKDFIASFYAGAFTNIAIWYADNPNVTKDQFSSYVHYYLKDRLGDDYR